MKASLVTGITGQGGSYPAYFFVGRRPHMHSGELTGGGQPGYASKALKILSLKLKAGFANLVRGMVIAGLKLLSLKPADFGVEPQA